MQHAAEHDCLCLRSRTSIFKENENPMENYTNILVDDKFFKEKNENEIFSQLKTNARQNHKT